MNKNTLISKIFSLLFLILIFISTNGCQPKETVTVIERVEVQQRTQNLLKPNNKSGLTEHITTSEIAVNSQVTFNKSKLFNRQFLYGADLQHSSIYDKESLLFNQVYTMGHEIVFFRRQNQVIQIVIDQTWKFESDVNTPERLLNEFPIIEESEETITVDISKPSPILRQMFWGSSTDVTRSAWLRSVEFHDDGEYLLIESSVETINGDIVEHLESFFPRENLVNQNTKVIYNSDDEPLSQRFKFISNQLAFINTEDGRVAKAAANRFDLTPQKTVKWYVTRNISDDIIVDVQNSVLAWNRYFQNMWGKNGFEFMGKLPEGVKLGDPRFNVIVWDNVQDGDAAYESQASDPLTGIQSHSNIYIPFSWLKTATEYWSNAQYASQIDDDNHKTNQKKNFIESKQFLGRKLKFGCYRNLNEIILSHSKSEGDLKILAREVLKSVIFHEVGHALGLDHNFKGSLIVENGQYTSTIMDYNHYNLESKVFDDINTSDGPLLEYDRQIIDVLYNNAQSIKSSRELPACNDFDADNTSGGIDPLCSRYDAGENPYQWLTETQNLIEKPKYKLGLLRSLTESLQDLVALLEQPQLVTNKEKFDQKINLLFSTEKAQFNFYLTGGAHSLRYMLQTSLKSLKGLQPGILDNTPFKEIDFRNQTIASLNYLFSMQDIPTEPLNVLHLNLDQAIIWTKSTPYFLSLSLIEQNQIISDIQNKHSDLLITISGQNDRSVLSVTRSRVLALLKFDENNSYYYSAAENIDAEKYAINLLKSVAISKSQGNLKRSMKERLAAVNSLVSFKDLETSTESITELKNSLQKELVETTQSSERNNIRKLLSLLK